MSSARVKRDFRVRQRGLVPVVAVGDEHGQRLERGVQRSVDGRVGDHPEPVHRLLRAREHKRRPALRDHLQDLSHTHVGSLVNEPEWLEGDVRCAQQRQSVLFRPAMGALVGQHDPVRIRHEAERRDQVQPPPSIELDLVDVHRLRVWLEDATVHPFFEGARRAGVVGTGPGQPDDVVWRQRPVARQVRFGDDVVGRRDERAWIACPCQVVADAGQRADVSYRRLRRARRSADPTCRRPRAAAPEPQARHGRPPPGSSSRCHEGRRDPPACSRC